MCASRCQEERDRKTEKKKVEKEEEEEAYLQRYAPNDLLLPSRLHLKIKKKMLKKMFEFILCG